MGTYVKAHIRNGKMVKAYTRGGGKVQGKSKNSTKSFNKLLGQIEKQHGKVMSKKAKVTELKNKNSSLTTPKKPTARQAQKNMNALFAKHNIKVDYTTPIKGRTIKRS